MDFLTFLSSIIATLSWPITLLVLVVMLKKPISELIPLLRKLKYKELEMEFRDGVSELKVAAIESDLSVSVASPAVQNEESRLVKLANISPRAAIMEAWIHVENAAIELVSSFYNQDPSDTLKNYSKLGEYLLDVKVIDSKQLEFFNKLRQLRNKAAHAEELSLNESDAKAYVEFAYSLAEHIKNH